MQNPGLLLILNMLHLHAHTQAHNIVFISLHEQRGRDFILIFIWNFPIALGANVLQQK